MEKPPQPSLTHRSTYTPGAPLGSGSPALSPLHKLRASSSCFSLFTCWPQVPPLKAQQFLGNQV